MKFGSVLRVQPAVDSETAHQVMQAVQLLEQIGERFNLFTFLGGLPLLQVPSLLTRHMPGGLTPLGEPRVFPLASILTLIVCWCGLILAGLVLGFLYLNDLASRIRTVYPSAGEGENEQPAVSNTRAKFVRFLLFAVGLLVSGMAFFSVWALVVAISTAIAEAFGILFWMLGVAAASYAAFHLIFVVPGVLLGGRGVMQATLESILLSHKSLSSVLGLVVLVIVIYEGLGYAWSLPSGDSWLLLIGILGNAAVATGLTVATFVFYQERVKVSG